MSGAIRDWGAFRIHVGDCRDSMRSMAAGSAQCCVTSPPYFGLRDYGVDGQIGLEPTPGEYVTQMVQVFAEVWRVLADDGVLWLNLGDSYANDSKWGGSSSGKHVLALHGDSGIGRGKRETGLKSKDLIGIPWRVAFALQEAGWYLRQDVIWHKPNPMPESVTDRCTKAHEYLFMLTKNERYFFDHEAIKEPAKEWSGQAATFDRGANPVAAHILPGQSAAQHRPRKPGKNEELGKRQYAGFNARWDAATADGAPPTRNRRSVWTVATRPFKGAHFATFPPALIEPCVLSGSRPGDTVLDPFGGAGTTALVATQHGRRSVLCELNPAYADIAERRVATALFGDLAFGGAAA